MRKLLFIFIVFLISCGDSNTKNIDINSISISKLDFEKTNYSYGDIVEDSYYVPLETIDSVNLIGKIDKLVLFDSMIFILDRYISKAIFIFSENGKFLSKIDKIGDGPGEFKEPFDMIIDPKLNQLIVYCKQKSKLVYYGLDGVYVDEHPIDINFRSFALYNDDYLLFTHSIYNFVENYGEVPYDFITLDDNGSIISKQFLNGMESGKSGVVITHNKYFTHNNNQVFLSWIFNDTIYKISNDNKAIPFCYFDFGEQSIPMQVLNNTEDIYLYKDVVMEGKYWSKYGPFEATDDFFIITISAGISDETKRNFYFVLFSRDMNSKIVFAQIENKIDDGIFTFPLTNYNNYFVSVIYTEQIVANKENNNDKTHIKFNGVTSRIKEFDNPILLFTKFKEI